MWYRIKQLLCIHKKVKVDCGFEYAVLGIEKFCCSKCGKDMT